MICEACRRFGDKQHRGEQFKVLIDLYDLFNSTVFLPNLYNQRDRTVPHSNVLYCVTVFFNHIVTFTVIFYTVTRTITANVTFSVMENIPLQLPLPVLSVIHA